MKKILMLTSDKNSKTKNHFVELLTKNFIDNSKIELQNINDVEIYAGKSLIVSINGHEITNYDMVIFRGVASKDQSLASSIAMCLKKLNVKFIDGVYGEMGISEKKLGTLLKLYVSGVKIPDTYFIGKNILDEANYNDIVDKLGLPFVAKDMFLQRGLGVFLINNLNDFNNLPKRQHMFQKFLDKKHEYRILVLGQNVGVYEEKISDNKDEFRNNVALGAKEVFFDKNNIPDQIKNMSLTGSKLLNLQIAGVDVVEDINGVMYILEINRGPGLTYDENLSPEFKEIAEFLEQYE